MKMFRHTTAILLIFLLFEHSLCAPRRKRKDNVDERGSYFESDMRLTLRQERTARGGSLSYVTKWPKGRVYYTLSDEFSHDEESMILEAMAEFEQKSCIRWIPRSHQSDYVNFFKANGCWSFLGLRGGKQNISLAGECFYKIGVVRHEMLHALGFAHEHSRKDRNNHITILWDNIEEDKRHNFATTFTRDVSPYDFGYGWQWFSQ